MAIIAWTPRLELGVPEIDQQHRQLIGTINRLYGQLIVGAGRDVVGPLLEEIERCAEHHFLCEERLMDACGYAHRDGHKAAHRDLLEELRRYCDECILESGSPEVVVSHLERWLARHIDEADRSLATTLNAALA